MDKIVKKYPVSLMFIAKNAAADLPRMLEHLAPWVNEIVAVINDCTDDTEDVLASYGARIYKQPWKGFGAARQTAFSHCTQPWVLSLDTDEVCTAELVCALQAVIDKDDPSVAGVRFPCCTQFLGKWIRHGDWYPDHWMGLFRRDRARLVEVSIHDYFICEGKVVTIDVDLLHYSFPTIEHMVRKIPPCANAFALNAQNKGKKFCAPEVVFRTLWRFFRGYILRAGFLDGYAGFYIAWYEAFFCMYRYTQIWEISQPTDPSAQ